MKVTLINAVLCFSFFATLACCEKEGKNFHPILSFVPPFDNSKSSLHNLTPLLQITDPILSPIGKLNSHQSSLKTSWF